MDRLLQKVKISLTLIQKSIINPTYQIIRTCTLLYPPGKIVVIQNRPKYKTSWERHGQVDWYFVQEMEHYRFHMAHITKTRVERISDTVESPPRKFNTPEISSTGATINSVQDLIHALQNPPSSRTLVTLVNSNKETLRSLYDIFIKRTSPSVPLRVPTEGHTKRNSNR